MIEVVIAAAEINSRLLSLQQVRYLLQGAKEIRRCGDSLEDAACRNGGSLDLRKILPDGFEGNIRYDPTTIDGQVYSKQLIFQSNPDGWYPIGLAPGY